MPLHYAETLDTAAAWAAHDAALATAPDPVTVDEAADEAEVDEEQAERDDPRWDFDPRRDAFRYSY